MGLPPTTQPLWPLWLLGATLLLLLGMAYWYSIDSALLSRLLLGAG